MHNTFDPAETYFAFGDGSETGHGCFYGLVLIPEKFVRLAEQTLVDIKQKYGGQPDTPLHCREIFAADARLKSGWGHLSLEQAMEMCGDILSAMEKYMPIYRAGFTPREHYPKTVRLKGKNGHADLVHAVDSKYLTLKIYHRLASELDPIEVIVPPNPISIPQPASAPKWRVHVYRNISGVKVKNIFIDRENTKIRWFSKSVQWTTVARDLVISRPGFEDSFLPVEIAGEVKHSLLEWADLFVYSVARSFGGRGGLILGSFKGNADITIFGQPTEEIVFGGEIGPSFMQASNTGLGVTCTFSGMLSV